ncbi:hypothetical protein Dda_7570 [Drechslerella dactyloides]|uniref:Trafficking protein particle complex subunit n=1 Tax=Drechslerella dactyloides TaxID=74499 RepID=A0AAD6ISW0_DREDA|nr:hypothetical protein Dda_7570 [Drechslerella dactyloides]
MWRERAVLSLANVRVRSLGPVAEDGLDEQTRLGVRERRDVLEFAQLQLGAGFLVAVDLLLRAGDHGGQGAAGVRAARLAVHRDDGFNYGLRAGERAADAEEGGTAGDGCLQGREGPTLGVPAIRRTAVALSRGLLGARVIAAREGGGRGDGDDGDGEGGRLMEEDSVERQQAAFLGERTAKEASQHGRPPATRRRGKKRRSQGQASRPGGWTDDREGAMERRWHLDGACEGSTRRRKRSINARRAAPACETGFQRGLQRAISGCSPHRCNCEPPPERKTSIASSAEAPPLQVPIAGLTMVVYAVLILNKAGGLIFQRDFNPGLQKLTANDYLIIAGTFHGVHAITSQISPTNETAASGLEVLESENFVMRCFQTLTGTKFLVFAEPRQPNLDVVVRRVYELYADYVMKNPFYQIEMPIRSEGFERHLAAYIKPHQ